MKHSPTTVSDILNDLIEVDEEINNLLLVGQQVSLIETAGELYNHLRSLVTDPYLTEAEYKWVCWPLRAAKNLLRGLVVALHHRRQSRKSWRGLNTQRPRPRGES